MTRKFLTITVVSLASKGNLGKDRTCLPFHYICKVSHYRINLYHDNGNIYHRRHLTMVRKALIKDGTCLPYHCQGKAYHDKGIYYHYNGKPSFIFETFIPW